MISLWASNNNGYMLDILLKCRIREYIRLVNILQLHTELVTTALLSGLQPSFSKSLILCVLILYMRGKIYGLKSISKDSFLSNFYSMGIYVRYLLRRKNISHTLFSRRCLTFDLNYGHTSYKPIYSLQRVFIISQKKNVLQSPLILIIIENSLYRFCIFIDCSKQVHIKNQSLV